METQLSGKSQLEIHVIPIRMNLGSACVMNLMIRLFHGNMHMNLFALNASSMASPFIIVWFRTYHIFTEVDSFQYVIDACSLQNRLFSGTSS